MALAANARPEHDTNAGALLSNPSAVGSAQRGRPRHRSYSDSKGSDAAGSRMQSMPSAPTKEHAQATPHFRDVLNKKFPPATMKPSMRDDDIAALVNFLNNQAPPSSSFTSTPYDADNALGRGRWTKLRMIGKRSKSVPKPQPQIRLPDSAVSGITTGGHRHIAISIPLEASPFGQMAHSQYPVIPPRDEAALGSRSPSVRTFVNDKGVVSVLRAVDEDGNGSTSYGRARPASFRSQPTLPGARTRFDQRTKSPHASFSRSQPDIARAQYRHSRGLSSPSESVFTDAETMFPDTIQEEQGATTPGVRVPKSIQRPVYPTRLSSSMCGRGIQLTDSIDNIIFQIPRKRDSLMSSRDDLEQQPSADKAAISMSPSVYSSRPDSVVDTPGSERTADVPLLAREGAPDPLQLKRRSRRDLVKDRKKRDMEAARSAKLAPRASEYNNEQPPIPPKAQGRGFNGHAMLGNQGSDLEESDPFIANDIAQDMAAKSRFRLSPVMVVIDEEPSTPCLQTTHLQRPQTAMASLPGNGEVGKSAFSSCVDKAGNPTPPHSNQGSPPQKHHNLDRTSLSRRREWNEFLERERKAKEAKGVGRVKIGRLNMSTVPYEPVKADNDLLRVGDVHREQRLHDMERRLQRLERNGDVWLRALIPMLKNMDQTLTSSVRDNEDRGWASDGESDGAAGRRSKSLNWDKSDYEVKEKLKRPVSYAPGELLEELAKGRRSLDSWADDASYPEDRTGLASLEPLMRELAADVQFRPGTT